MKKFLFLLSIFLFLLYSCRTVQKCPAYGETYRFQGTYKAHNKRSGGKCSAYGEVKKFQKGSKHYNRFNRYKYSCPAYGDTKKFQKKPVYK